jgi:hypothetical protein
MDEQQQQLISRLKESSNVLVTVRSNPTADQLAAAIGLTLALNKLNKHATAVFSGAVPSAIAFLQPEKTLHKNTDSLRDFIISLDRDKADKLRYKVEDKLVRIFISPYHGAINESDLIFSQGDFNIDTVVALGVQEQRDLDHTITAHGRILHDATVATINTIIGNTGLGSISIVDQNTSSMSETIERLITALGKDLIDNQIATALLTGIVAETDRFSNDKTKPTTLEVSSKLMAAGANQQLVASKLEEAKRPPPPPPWLAGQNELRPDEGAVLPKPTPQPDSVPDENGVLWIDHQVGDSVVDSAASAYEEHPINIDEQGRLYMEDAPDDGSQQDPGSEQLDNDSDQSNASDDYDGQSATPADNIPSDQFADNEPAHDYPKIVTKPSKAMVKEPPELVDGALTPDSGNQYDDDDVVNPLAVANDRNQRILSHDEPTGQHHPPTPPQPPLPPRQPDYTPPPDPVNAPLPPAEQSKPLENKTNTLADIEQAVGAHMQTNAPPAEQLSAPVVDGPLEPIQALNALPVDLNIHPDSQPPQQPGVSQQAPPPPPPPPVPPPMPSMADASSGPQLPPVRY